MKLRQWISKTSCRKKHGFWISHQFTINQPLFYNQSTTKDFGMVGTYGNAAVVNTGAATQSFQD